eukprot:scaffold277178_cov18-Tisochrysis_lutea.AAC.1
MHKCIAATIGHKAEAGAAQSLNNPHGSMHLQDCERHGWDKLSPKGKGSRFQSRHPKDDDLPWLLSASFKAEGHPADMLDTPSCISTVFCTVACFMGTVGATTDF